MTRINTNVSSLIAQNRLSRSNTDLQTALNRLSTGLQINNGSDDPAGLIASESLRSDITSINKAISNTKRANQIIATADSALGQVSSLLNDVRGLVVEAANTGALSADEIAANQLQVDSSLEAINRIAQTTTFQGRRLLDGSLDFITSEGSGFSTVRDLQIDQANLGATGNISVNIAVQSAATKASVSTAGIPAATTAVQSSGTLAFNAPAADVEASGTASFTNSFVIGAEASNTISLANATTPGSEASGTLSLDTSGANIDIVAVDGSAVDGEVGNDVTISVTTVANGTASSGTYDAGTNTLNLVVEEGETSVNIAADLAADANINGLFTIADGGGGLSSSAGDDGVYTGVLSGAVDATDPTTAFDLTAVDGGAADGDVGNSTDLVFTTGAATTAAFDAVNNVLTVTVADGATIDDVAAAINSDVGADFQASNVVNGSYAYSAADNAGASGTSLLGGASPAVTSSFDIEAVNGGVADGTAGNNATLEIASGATTEATYDADNNVLNITLATGATVDDLAAAITAEGTFVTKNVQNGNSLFSALDEGTTDPALTGGTDALGDDIITVTADEASPSADGVTIAVNSDNSLAAGTANASIDVDGNIVVNVSSLGAVNIGTIATAIDQLDGFGASVTGTDGDGVIDIDNDTPAVTTPLGGGIFGGGLNDDLVVQLSGATGSEVFQFERGTGLDAILQAINLVSDATGVEAENDGGNLKLNSTGYGSEALVAVDVINEGELGTFEAGLTTDRSNGTDIQATVNGTSATARGNTLSINTATLDLSLTVEDGSATSVAFSITGGGAQFQLGPDVVSNQQARLGINSLNTAKLGGSAGRLFELASGGTKSLTNDVTGAANVIEEVINKVTGLRGRLGAFQATTLDTNLSSLRETSANLTEAESSIRDADFASESARLTRAQILVQSGTAVLAISNQNPQNVLALLR